MVKMVVVVVRMRVRMVKTLINAIVGHFLINKKTYSQGNYPNRFFIYVLLSGEDLDGGILQSYILEADEALVLSAVDHFDDSSTKSM